MDHVGLDAAYRARTQCTLYTLEVHIHYLREVKADDQLTVQTLILDCDRKRIHAGCLFACERLPEPVATAECMLMHVHQGGTVASAPFPPEIEARLRSLQSTPAARVPFAPASRAIEIRRR
jgi:acyl-CoA thioesterase FadM